MLRSANFSKISPIRKLSHSYQPFQIPTFLHTFKSNPKLINSAPIFHTISSKSFSTLRKSQQLSFPASFSNQYLNKTTTNSQSILQTQRHCLSTTPSPPLPSSTSTIAETIKNSDLKTTPDIELPHSFPKFKSIEDFFAWYKTDPKTKYAQFSPAWWASLSWLMLMYSVTCFTTVTAIRGMFKFNGIENMSLCGGETSHCIIYYLLLVPTFSLLIVPFGRIFGRPQHAMNKLRPIWNAFLHTIEGWFLW